jgi:hypothetical protein
VPPRRQLDVAEMRQHDRLIPLVAEGGGVRAKPLNRTYDLLNGSTFGLATAGDEIADSARPANRRSSRFVGINSAPSAHGV